MVDHEGGSVREAMRKRDSVFNTQINTLIESFR
jgi:hypothetical protein